jgi:hypothetical protein
MCYIICTSSSVYVALGVWGGFEGGAGAVPPRKKICLGKHVTYLGGFSAHGLFFDGFLFPVKELGLLTNLGHWVRVLDAVGSYMYIVL